MKKIFRNCPNEACLDCRRCYNYQHCQERLAARKRRQAAQAVKVTYCQPVRRPRYAYAYALFNSWMESISIKQISKWIAIILAVIFLANPFSRAVIQFAEDLGNDNRKEATQVTSEMGIVEIETKLEKELFEELDEMVNVVIEEVTPYPDAVPGEEYTATYVGARPYKVYFFSYEEMVMMAKVVYREARGECERGRVAVVAVIINRLLNGEFGNSISEVIKQENAFANISCVTDEMLKANPQCMEAVELACNGWDPTREWFEDGALFFYNPNGDLSDEARAAREGVEQYAIGNHNFHIELNET